MKLCINCKHHTLAAHYEDYDTPVHICNVNVSLVTGNTIRLFCEQERHAEGYNRCGEEGKKWEPKPVKEC